MSSITNTDFLQATNDVLRGTDDDPPVIGTDEASYWLRTANRIRRNLYRNASLQLVGSYQVLELGTVSASAAPSFDLDDNFIAPAESCYVIDSSGSRHDFKVIKPQQREPQTQSVFIAGQDPQTLFFSSAITSTQNYIGGKLFLPAYVMPDDMSTASGSATVVVDDPDWLVIATAAKLAFGDITYEDKVADLNAEANALYNVMIKNNRRGSYGNTRTTPTMTRTRLGERHSSR